MSFLLAHKWKVGSLLLIMLGLGWLAQQGTKSPNSLKRAEETKAKRPRQRSLQAPRRPQGLPGVSPSTSDETADEERIGTLSYSGSQECWDACGSPCSLVTGQPVCGKECDEDDECDSDELCTVTSTQKDGDRRWRCQKSHCAIDDDCGPGKACSRFARAGGHILLCKKSGVRTVGEPCAHDEFAAIGLCARGLQCFNGICTRDRCDLEDPNADSECGRGGICGRNELGFGLCNPGCESDDDCQAGERCDSERTHVAKRCIRDGAFGCLRADCPDPGSKCVVNSDGMTLKITSCMRPCQSAVDCGEEEVCGVQQDDDSWEKYCYLRCGEVLGNCGDVDDGWYCERSAISSEGELVTACTRNILGSQTNFYEKVSAETEP